MVRKGKRTKYMEYALIFFINSGSLERDIE